MPGANQDNITIHVNIEISAFALQAIVTNAKRLASKDTSGICRIDTADQVSNMISRFLREKDFDNYVLDPDHYDADHR